MSVIVLDQSFHNEVFDVSNGVGLHLCIVFKKRIKRFKNVLFFVDCVRLNKFSIFFDYFAYKRFDWL